MGLADNVRAIELPNPKQIIGGYKEAKMAVKRIDVNTINVRFFPANSPFFVPTKGELYHFTTVTLLKIDVPEKLGFIIQDDSIFFDKTTKEEWVDARQDYPLTLSVNRQLGALLINAIQQFPDVLNWYIPSAINKIPVKNIVIRRDMKAIADSKTELEKVGISRNLVEWIDQIPVEVTITPKFLYDYVDIQVIGSLKNEEGKFNWVIFIMGGLFFSLLTMAFMLYIGR